MLKRYPLILSCLVMGSLNFTRSSYAVRSIPWSSKRCGRSSYKKSTSRFTSTPLDCDCGWFWSTRLSLRAHFKFFRVLMAEFLDWQPYLCRPQVWLAAGRGRRIWRESWVVAICCSPCELLGYTWRGLSLDLIHLWLIIFYIHASSWIINFKNKKWDIKAILICFSI